MDLIQNPILPGFHPDPSICKVGDDFYLATSTFEWFPGVLIYHSRDLRHWQLIARPLDRLSLLDMRGEVPSAGVWAPCLSHDGERFHLVYSDTKGMSPQVWDVSNYLSTAENIAGPWSERILLNHCGFDPSMFHDADGRKWTVTLSQDTRPGHNRFGGIELQEYSPRQQKLIGEPKLIYTGSDLGCSEGPHLYRHNDWYYLMVAEGGTSYQHATTLARSRQLEGPWETDPDYPLLTSANHPEADLQKAGHASLVEAAPGEWYIVHLCGRPLGTDRRCILGRETALQAVEWTEAGWLRLRHGGNVPQLKVPAPSLPEHPFPALPSRRFFDGPELPPEFQTLREPVHPEWCTLNERPGWLRLYGRRSLYANFEQSLVGRRVQHLSCQVETLIDYQPEHHQQAAGLAMLYDSYGFYDLALTFDPDQGRILRLIVSDQQKESYPLPDIPVPAGPLRLRASFENTILRFAWASENGEWQPLDIELDASILSDDYGPRYRFTGSFFCLHAHDFTLRHTPADFRYFDYKS